MTFTLKPVGSISEIGQAAWDACANPHSVSSDADASGSSSVSYVHPYDPFVSYNFLHALEESGSAVAETGWAPYHLQLLNENDEVFGVVPMYLKNHSQGEYVFDYSWADAFERAGGRYYPKLQVSVPFTPVTGRRILAKPSTGCLLYTSPSPRDRG